MKLLKTRTLISKLREKELRHKCGKPITDYEYREVVKEIKSFERLNKKLKLAFVIAVSALALSLLYN